VIPIRPPSKLRTLLVLGRVSNVPTVWSNCLAGWWLGGGSSWLHLTLLCFFMMLLYIGGMYLNDAFDANFDRQHRRSRPIPSGAISEKEVWQWGFFYLAAGVLGLVWAGTTTTILTLLLVGCILLYNAIHKLTAIAPLVMGACRFFVYVVAAAVARAETGESVGEGAMTGYPWWCGLALAIYVMGLSFLARKEIRRGPAPSWPCLLLAAPVILAAMCDDGPARFAGITLFLVLCAWVLWSIREILWRPNPNVGYAVGRLLAGITLVDLLAVADLTRPWSALFIIWFVLALLWQRYIPAT
jgi:UbiA prenyltransferase family